MININIGIADNFQSERVFTKKKLINHLHPFHPQSSPQQPEK